MDNLLYENKSGWINISDDDKSNIFKFADEYMHFLNHSKTEREIVETSLKIAQENGFVDISSKTELKIGDKVYFVNRCKNLFLAVIGEDSM